MPKRPAQRNRRRWQQRMEEQPCRSSSRSRSSRSSSSRRRSSIRSRSRRSSIRSRSKQQEHSSSRDGVSL